MSDLISRQAAIDIVDKYFKKIALNGDICIDGLMSLPSAQPEIIHCRDCRYSVDFYKDGCCYCMREFKGMRYIEEGFGFYCAGAERRTDGK